MLLIARQGQSPHDYSVVIAHSTHHLDAALHHYDTLHVAEVSHTSSVDHLRHSVTLRTLGRHFHMVLEWDRNIFTKDSVVYSVDGEGHRKRHDIDRHAFLRGHLKGNYSGFLNSAPPKGKKKLHWRF